MNKAKIESLIVLLGMIAGAQAHDNAAPAYPQMAPLAQYLIADRQQEIALARSAAPPSISADAEVLVLGAHGYERALEGKNGFVCFVERSWTADFDDPEFWNPRTRAPNCFNPPAVRSVLPQFLKRTEWALAGDSKAQMKEKTRTAMEQHLFKPPEPASLSFMLSKQGYLGDAAGGTWYPHVMFFVPHGETASWAAGLKASPVIGVEAGPLDPTVLFVPVLRWSDGSPAPSPQGHVHHT
jgi:hypothetical protein